MILLGLGAGIAAAESAAPPASGRVTATMGVSVTVVAPSKPPPAK